MKKSHKLINLHNRMVNNRNIRFMTVWLCFFLYICPPDGILNKHTVKFTKIKQKKRIKKVKTT